MTLNILFLSITIKKRRISVEEAMHQEMVERLYEEIEIGKFPCIIGCKYQKFANKERWFYIWFISFKEEKLVCGLWKIPPNER